MRLFLDHIRERLCTVVRALYAGNDSTASSKDGLDRILDSFAVSVAKPGFGDASSNIAFLLARALKKSPGEIARAVSERYNETLKEDGLVLRTAAHKSGYVNFDAHWGRLSKLILADSLLDSFGGSDVGGGSTITIEHTSVNPNKALHIGHIRNIIIGDTISKILVKSGYRVNVLNYVDDSGLQVADVIVGFRHLGFAPEPPAGKSFAQYCGDDVYVKTTTQYESDPKLESMRRDVLASIEAGSNETADFAAAITRRVLADQLQTCWRLSVYYDCLNFESHILRSGLWQSAFEKLKQMGLVELDCSGGKNDGCWVIRDAHAAPARDGKDKSYVSTTPTTTTTTQISDNTDEKDAANRDKVIVRSNGTATYIAKDIPYAAWKLGLVDDPFEYVRYEHMQPGGEKTLWQTELLPLEQSNDTGNADDDDDDNDAQMPDSERTKRLEFAGGRVITVIDSRQSGLQRIIVDLMRRFKSDESAYVHLAYESVTLSPATAGALGLETGGRQAQMSGRRGLYVDADSVYEMLRKKAESETKNRHPDMPADEIGRISHAIAVGAIRYEMIKQDLDKIITFDLERSTSLDGDTASYIQYAGARASRIIEKAGSPPPADQISFDLFSSRQELDLIRLIGTFEMAVSDAARNLSPKVVARHCHEMAVGFNAFYEHCRVLGLDDPALADARLYLVWSFRDALAGALDLVGIEAPKVM